MFHFICSFAPFIVFVLSGMGTTSKKLAGKHDDGLFALLVSCRSSSVDSSSFWQTHR